MGVNKMSELQLIPVTQDIKVAFSPVSGRLRQDRGVGGSGGLAGVSRGLRSLR